MKKNRGKWEGSIVSSEAGTMRGAHEYLLTEGKNEGIKKLKKKKECKHKELLKDNLNTGSIISS